ncbi:uncharacterized protein LOC129300675 [Prosopis cineraria]|uniref:uncharacterized protein LOC129300675 n=1 Tax=Prosopis cineraria TaxID=364024 RepID=UPI0024108A50|nr:uncharacterized protein LOC129300675 [Prosopis cineraria]
MGTRIEILEQEAGEVRTEMASLNEKLGVLEFRINAARDLIMHMLESLPRKQEREIGKSHLQAEKMVPNCPGAYRLEFPIFSGEDDPYGWILKAERYFMLYGIEDREKVACATLNMEGKALNWFLWVEARNPIQCWEMFKQELMERFQTTKGDLAYEQLLSLRQFTTVAHYREQFELLSASLRDIPDEMLRCMFVNGLNDDIKAVVKSIGSRDLNRVMSLAQEIEDKNKISEMMEEVKLPRRSYGNRSKSNSFDEMAPRSMDPNENLLGEEEGEMCDKEEIKKEEEQESVMGESQKLPMNQTVATKPHSFKFLGKIGSREVIVLIGTAATHNFISKEVVTALKIPVERTERFWVNFGFGPEAEGSEVSRRVVLRAQGIEIEQSFFPTKLGTADVVLGGQWLRSLGSYAIQGSPMTMTFKWGGRKVTLQADPSLTKGAEIGVITLRWNENS